ncbi:nucleotide sugar dehydrogenase [Rhizobium subbaraonis]|uniref:Nucleotide sugar dehydrogenase n=1 Tax=Rhizobium subbaraonis TaxID=908946 RepID=A0A285UGL5_9HYPH|nr:nucleotide sugar dehydrogenase [Rhizobium subbaraonis]
MNEVFRGRLAIIGMGYIGLPTAVAIATRGIDVIGVDINPATVAAISRGEVPFVEPDLAVAVSGAVAMGRLKATTETPEADAFIIAVPTPFNEDRTADLSYVKAAAEQIAPKLKPGDIVVLESTSPPGTTEKIGTWIGALRPDLRMPRDGQAVATGMSHVLGEPENIAYLNLFFESRLIAHIHVNWLAPVKVRRTLIGGSSKMIVYDDLEPSEKIKVYDKGITLNGGPQTNGDVYQMLVGYRTGDMYAPQLDMTEALNRELRQFVSCVENNEQPVADGHAGLRVVRILEAATQSLAQRGRVVELGQARMIA